MIRCPNSWTHLIKAFHERLIIMQVICKWYKNDRPDAPEIISRTLLKIAVVSKNTFANKESVPLHGEIWLCRIVKETKPGTNTGCFIVEPMKRLRAENEDGDGEVGRLYPGSYTTESLNGRVLVRPKHPGHWMLPLEHKRLLAEQEKAYCVIVDLEPQVTKPETTL